MQSNCMKKIAFYKSLPLEYPGDELFKMIVSDLKTLQPEKLRMSLVERLLWEKPREEVVLSVERDDLLDYLVEAVYYCVYYNTRHRDLLYLISFLKQDDFKALVERVQGKIPKDLYLNMRSTLTDFLLYLLDVKKQFYLEELPEEPLWLKVDCVRSFLEDIFPVMPYLSEEKFWTLAQYIRHLIDSKTPCMGYLLNNDHIIEDVEFMVEVLKVYLSSDKNMKLSKYKLLIDTPVLEKLSPEQVAELTTRAVEDGIAVRFRFTKAAFEILKAKFLSWMLLSGSSTLRRQYQETISACEIV